ncbi:hypothetical protein SO694_00060043 [Aureococcus anophagefferens]|uniref:NERD domain-containing protein n=1 Tax=Aureococcus anophagefferens TaxID=44056 RepID=A0ABR1FR00_AURAN
MPTFLRSPLRSALRRTPTKEKRAAPEPAVDAAAELEARAEARARALIDDGWPEERHPTPTSANDWSKLLREATTSSGVVKEVEVEFAGDARGLDICVVEDFHGRQLLVVDRVWPASDARHAVKPTDVLSHVGGLSIFRILESRGWALPEDFAALRSYIRAAPRPLAMTFQGLLGREITALRHARQHELARRALVACRRRARKRLNARRAERDRAASRGLKRTIAARLQAHGIRDEAALADAVDHEKKLVARARACSRKRRARRGRLGDASSARALADARKRLADHATARRRPPAPARWRPAARDDDDDAPGRPVVRRRSSTDFPFYEEL